MFMHAFLCLYVSMFMYLYVYVSLCLSISMFIFVVFYEPTDTDKATKPFIAGVQDCLTYIKPNIHEFKKIYQCITGMYYSSHVCLLL